MIFHTDIKKEKGVYLASAVTTEFQDFYIKVRDLEKRVLNNEEVALLPNTYESNPYKHEWKLRKRSADRFVSYLKQQTHPIHLLEIGSGNGWFSHLCSQHVQKAVGIDVNLLELEQATAVFKKENLSYGYWDIFDENPFSISFDIIVLNASIQYFPSFEKLFKQLEFLLKPEGEIHILDSPFYQEEEIGGAKKRTQDYFERMGVKEMCDHYFHHSENQLAGFDTLYSPPKGFFLKLVRRREIPFSWYRKKC